MLATAAAMMMMLCVMVGCASTETCESCEDKPVTATPQTAATAQTAATKTAGLYRHVVVFRFKDTATPEQIDAINKAFAKLSTQIDTIRDFEWGANVSPEKLADGFTHCYLVTFDNVDGLNAYLPHDAHQAFVKKLKPILDKAFVVDYVARND
jgi:hypothetical protein